MRSQNTDYSLHIRLFPRLIKRGQLRSIVLNNDFVKETRSPFCMFFPFIVGGFKYDSTSRLTNATSCQYLVMNMHSLWIYANGFYCFPTPISPILLGYYVQFLSESLLFLLLLVFCLVMSVTWKSIRDINGGHSLSLSHSDEVREMTPATSLHLSQRP